MPELLIKNIGWLVAMDADRSVTSDAWLLAEDGFIKGTGNGAPPKVASGTAVLDARGGIATPGLVNTHHHFYQTMARAYTPGNSLPLLSCLASCGDRSPRRTCISPRNSPWRN